MGPNKEIFFGGKIAKTKNIGIDRKNISTKFGQSKGLDIYYWQVWDGSKFRKIRKFFVDSPPPPRVKIFHRPPQRTQ